MNSATVKANSSPLNFFGTEVQIVLETISLLVRMNMRLSKRSGLLTDGPQKALCNLGCEEIVLVVRKRVY